MGVVKRIVVLSAFLLTLAVLTAPAAHARTHVQFYVCQGALRALNSGTLGMTRAGTPVTNPYLSQCYPQATVNVYAHGTLSNSTLYANSTGTAKANPFTASTNAFASFYIDDGVYDFTFSGGGITTPFSWSDITISSGAVGVTVTGFGAVCDGTTDDTVAQQAAITFAGSSALASTKTVTWPRGSCLTTDTLTVANPHIQLLGAGKGVTTMLFTPTSGGKPVFDVYSASATLAYVKIDGFSFHSTNTTLQKIMVRARDVEEMEISNIASTGSGWTDTGKTSIGVQIKGRQMINLHDSTIFAPVPINIGVNPTFAGLDCDHCHFWNLYLGAEGTSNYNIAVDAAAVLTNFTVDGYQAHVKGKGGFSWPSTAASASSSVLLSNIRHEQTESATGYVVDIGSTANINALILRNIYGGSGMNGIRIRKANYVTIENFFYVGALVALDVDSTVNELAWISSYAGAVPATASLTGQAIMLAGPLSSQSSGSPLRNPTLLKSTSNASIDFLLNGTRTWSASGNLANAGQFNILGQTQAAGDKAYSILVAATNTTTNGPEGAFCIVSRGTSGSITCPAMSANFASTNVGNKLCLIWQNMQTVTLVNNLASSAAVDYTITVFYN